MAANKPMLVGMPELPAELEKDIEQVWQIVDRIARFQETGWSLLALAKVSAMVNAQAVNPLLHIGCHALEAKGLVAPPPKQH